MSDSPSARETEKKKHTGPITFLIRLVKEKPLGAIGAVITLVLLVTGLFAGSLAPYGMNETRVGPPLIGPSVEHPFGTDNLGRDVFSRVIYGSRVSMIIGLSATALGTIVAVTIGMLSGYLGGTFDLVVQRFVDGVLALPGLVLLMVLMSLVGPGMLSLILVMGIHGGIGGSRFSRSVVISIKENAYLEAARAVGSSTRRVLLQDVLPNIAAPLIVSFSLSVPGVILGEAGLSFLGFGIPPPAPSWGGMLSGSSRTYMFVAPWMVVFPGAALTMVVFGINMFGDAVRDLLDPRLKGGGVGRYGLTIRKMLRVDENATARAAKAVADQVEMELTKSERVLEVRDLKTYFYTDDGVVKAVDGLNYDVNTRECVGLVGESACGKSVSAMSLLRLIPYPPGVIVGGEILFKGEDLMQVSEKRMQEIRGNRIAMVFQEPTASLNPVLTVGRQISESLELHRGMGRAESRVEGNRLLELVGIPDAAQRFNDHPYQFSGGMQQRIVIAMALTCNPELIIADEPTTSLDVTVQAQILDILDNLRSEFNAAVIIISHNMGVIARHADRVNVMYAGKIVETAPTETIFAEPKHPYTLGLLASVPRLDKPSGENLRMIRGMPPNLARLPKGCSFAPRCDYAMPRCGEESPTLEKVGEGHIRACFYDADKLERQE
jgi:peptide/nickel transport system permease protein